MIQALLIDFDGVLRIWNRDNDRRAEEVVGLPFDAIRRVAFAPDILMPAITGRISDAEWRSTIVARLRRQFPHLDAQQAVGLWSASPGTIDHAVLDVLRRCRKKTQIVLITNATSRLSQDLQQLALVDEFDYVINSSVVGAAKPDSAIFKAALEAAKVPPSAALFIDDTPGYIPAATELGIIGHVYQDVGQLTQLLQTYALL